MDFAVYSEEKIEKANFSHPHIIISISDVPEYPATLPGNPLCLGILRLSFYDAVPGQFPERLMKPEHARQIWDFIELYRGKVGLIVV